MGVLRALKKCPWQARVSFLRQGGIVMVRRPSAHQLRGGLGLPGRNRMRLSCLRTQQWARIRVPEPRSLSPCWQPLENFEWLAQRTAARSEPPLLAASTLMVPGHIDACEISRTAGLIARFDPDIPYSLLGFHPDYRMTDLAPTSHEQARQCLDAARHIGLLMVKVGNEHLLR